ncbi:MULTISPECIES: bifunctional 4-hydroxy-2-oxoglutarate aldolase/2-dehydro-3-deoxy-phosphogluconate aldolase [Hymenobacter]|uniref:Bifunctional 4-hydroxy-2-oxoglutarate aldolase/2-dehydro-3-deoxy-phosphogluconate aldolase n=1 Tax=Hymenobacter profundi TaxID=1982110 RepID=A0ABS6X6H7_9BACT|nr:MULTISPECIES: bifunctional 4-hydroxy-2-oxoglutarate aldolase/2-dehydro-3-deoxy-phosphogluconate aldolase [Hymenobacter]MBW3130931.1 bifunctional 4-hydroxy-2-oxoglutarate aldolase/2-dehydro-3-deoxy-phosphogluconate aldolase [Hymenobacter profundi]QNE39554.1 bifunctional 4-hydroxy-2-oxoglutarate aldolase/2-dehydro-3-deoxy-phosphogluconate aldolase [Hymenobacter sp. NBH84]
MARFSRADALKQLLAHPLVPVFYHPDVAHAQQIVQACYNGGIRVFEFTNRGAQAFDVFTQLQSFVQTNCPEMLLGIGTIYEGEEAQRFIQAGADFVVQPVTTESVAHACKHADVAWLPGAMTLNEIYRAHQLGADVVKVFPGNTVGPSYIKAVRGPLPDVPLMVTGGVEPTEESIGEWLGAGVQAVGIGSQLFKGDAGAEALTAKVAGLVQFIQQRAQQ